MDVDEAESGKRTRRIQAHAPEGVGANEARWISGQS